MQQLEKTDDKHPLKIAYKSKHIYYDNFINLLEQFESILSKKELKELINKLHLTSKFDFQHYLQFASEMTTVYYILRKYRESFKNEPKYNDKKNPECSFKYHDRTINVEVKCPNLTKLRKIQQNNNLKILQHRVPNEFYSELKDATEDVRNKINLENSTYDKVEIQETIDNKLKDFIISAAEKFPQKSNDNFNILVISLDLISDLDEWYSYIYGDTGVFTDNSFVSKDYSNVDAILLSTTMRRHNNWELYKKSNIWNLEENINLLFLNHENQSEETIKFYENQAIYIFGNSSAKLRIMFHEYLKSLDSKERKIYEQTEDNDERLGLTLNRKMIKFQLISEFFKNRM